MRFRLTLKSDVSLLIPFNYQYALAGAFYHLVAEASPEYATWLHDHGFLDEKKSFKHFAFSKLFSDPKPTPAGQMLQYPMDLTWLVSIAAPETAKQFIIGIFQERQFYISSTSNIVRIKFVEQIPDPEFREQMRFKSISPILVEHGRMIVDNAGRKKMYSQHLQPGDPKMSQIIDSNLKRKWKSLNPTHELPESWAVEFLPDMAYIASKPNGKVSKMISFTTAEGHRVNRRCFECPFELKGTPELMETAYQSGLGHENAMGFGMIEII